MGRTYVVSSCSVFSLPVIILFIYAGLYIYLPSVTIKNFLRDRVFLTQELFCNLQFYIVQNILHGRSHMRIQVSRAAFNHFNIEAKLNLHCCFHYLQQQSKSKRKQSLLHRYIHFQDKCSLFPKLYCVGKIAYHHVDKDHTHKDSIIVP